MKVNISKITKLKNSESFIQVNLVKGFKYVDCAGELINYFSSDDKNTLDFNMDVNGLIMRNPTQYIAELKISPYLVWAKFINPATHDQIMSTFLKNFDEIINILKVDEVSRIGWRNYFVYEFNDKQQFEAYFETKSGIKSGKLSGSVYSLQNKVFKANLALQAVTKSTDKSIRGVLFDVDVFLEEKIKTADVAKKMKSIAHYLRDESGLLKTINETF